MIVRGEWSGGGGEGGRRRLVPEGGISYEWGGAAAPPSLCWIRGCLTHPLLFRKSGMAARTVHKKCYGVRRTCRSVSAAYAKFMKCSVPSLTSLSHRLSLLPLPPQWVMLCSVPLRWPGRSRSRAMSFERFRRCAQDTKAVKPRAMTHLALRP